MYKRQVYVGLCTRAFGQRYFAIPRTNAVFPAPRSPFMARQSPRESVFANSNPTLSVSSGDVVVFLKIMSISAPFVRKSFYSFKEGDRRRVDVLFACAESEAETQGGVDIVIGKTEAAENVTS